MHKYETKVTNDIKQDKSKGNKLWDNINKLRGKTGRNEDIQLLYDINEQPLKISEMDVEIEQNWDSIYKKNIQNDIIDIWNEDSKCIYKEFIENENLMKNIATYGNKNFPIVLREHFDSDISNLPRKRLKSRNSFIHATDELIQSPSTRRLEQWSQHLHSVPHRLPQTPSECLASGASGTWTEWRCLNRLLTEMGHCKHNLRKWKYTDEDDTTCDCKEADQTMEHLLECPLLRQTCSLDDLMAYSDVEKECVRQWIGLV